MLYVLDCLNLYNKKVQLITRFYIYLSIKKLESDFFEHFF